MSHDFYLESYYIIDFLEFSCPVGSKTHSHIQGPTKSLLDFQVGQSVPSNLKTVITLLRSRFFVTHKKYELNSKRCTETYLGRAKGSNPAALSVTVKTYPHKNDVRKFHFGLEFPGQAAQQLYQMGRSENACENLFFDLIIEKSSNCSRMDIKVPVNNNKAILNSFFDAQLHFEATKSKSLPLKVEKKINRDTDDLSIAIGLRGSTSYCRCKYYYFELELRHKVTSELHFCLMNRNWTQLHTILSNRLRLMAKKLIVHQAVENVHSLFIFSSLLSKLQVLKTKSTFPLCLDFGFGDSFPEFHAHGKLNLTAIGLYFLIIENKNNTLQLVNRTYRFTFSLVDLLKILGVAVDSCQKKAMIRNLRQIQSYSHFCLLLDPTGNKFSTKESSFINYLTIISHKSKSAEIIISGDLDLLCMLTNSSFVVSKTYIKTLFPCIRWSPTEIKTLFLFWSSVSLHNQTEDPYELHLSSCWPKGDSRVQRYTKTVQNILTLSKKKHFIGSFTFVEKLKKVVFDSLQKEL